MCCPETFDRLLYDQRPQALQVGQTLPDHVPVGAIRLHDDLAALEDVVVAWLVALDLLLEGLQKRQESGESFYCLSF